MSKEVYGGCLTRTMINILIMRWLGTEQEAEVFEWLAEVTGQDTWEISDPRVNLKVVFQLRDIPSRRGVRMCRGMERVRIIAERQIEKVLSDARSELKAIEEGNSSVEPNPSDAS